MATRAVTIRLDDVDYERLEAEASRVGMQVATLARIYVRAALPGSAPSEVERRSALEALLHLARITEKLPSIDAVELARGSREDLERRSPGP